VKPDSSYIQQLNAASVNGHPECRRRVALSGPGRRHSHPLRLTIHATSSVPSDERLNAMSNFTCLCFEDSVRPLLFCLILSDQTWRRIREKQECSLKLSFALSFRPPVTTYSMNNRRNIQDHAF
jgi:hypothetical protein